MANGSNYLNRSFNKSTAKYNPIDLVELAKKDISQRNRTEGIEISSGAKKSIERTQADRAEIQAKQDAARAKLREISATHITPLPDFDVSNQYSNRNTNAYRDYLLTNRRKEELPYNLAGSQIGQQMNPQAYRMEQGQRETPQDMANQNAIRNSFSDAGRQFMYGTERGVVQPLLNFVESSLDVPGGALYSAASQIYSNLAKSPNLDLKTRVGAAVAKQNLDKAAQTVYETNLIKDPDQYLQEINERYNPTEMQQQVMNYASSVVPILAATATGQGLGALTTAGTGLAATTAVSPAAASNAAFFANAAGSAANEAYKQTGNASQATAYGLLSGLAETATERIFDIAPGLMNSNGITRSLVQRAAQKVAKNPAVQSALSQLANIAGEGAEEILSAYLDPVAQRISGIDPNADAPTKEELVEAFLGGAIVSAGMNLGSGIGLAGLNTRQNTPLTDNERRTLARAQTTAGIRNLVREMRNQQVQNRDDVRRLNALRQAYDAAVEERRQQEQAQTGANANAPLDDAYWQSLQAPGEVDSSPEYNAPQVDPMRGTVPIVTDVLDAYNLTEGHRGAYRTELTQILRDVYAGNIDTNTAIERLEDIHLRMMYEARTAPEYDTAWDTLMNAVYTAQERGGMAMENAISRNDQRTEQRVNSTVRNAPEFIDNDLPVFGQDAAEMQEEYTRSLIEDLPEFTQMRQEIDELQERVDAYNQSRQPPVPPNQPPQNNQQNNNQPPLPPNNQPQQNPNNQPPNQPPIPPNQQQQNNQQNQPVQPRRRVNPIVRAIRRLRMEIVSGQLEIERAARAQKRINEGQANLEDFTQMVRASRDTANLMLGTRMVDSDGNNVVITDQNGNPMAGQNLQQIVEQVPEEQQELFNEYLLLLRHIDNLNAQRPPVFANLTLQQAQIRIQQIEQAVGQNGFNQFRATQENLRQWWRTIMINWAIPTGLISQQEFNALEQRYPNYTPVYYETNGRTGVERYLGAPNRSTGTSQLLRTFNGADRPILNYVDSYNAMVQRIVRLARQNELYRAMYEFAAFYPQQAAEFGLELDQVQMLNQTNTTLFDDTAPVDVDFLEDVRNGTYRVNGYDNGQRFTLFVNEDIFRGLQDLTQRQPEAMERVGRAASRPMKALITGLNPFFGVTNALRDIQTAAVNSIEQNPAKFMAMYARALQEMMTNSENYQHYLALGGSEANFIQHGQTYTESQQRQNRLANRVVNRFTQAFGWLPEQTETLSRFAEYLRGIERYGDDANGRRKAMQAAADVTVNFGRSGSAKWYRNLDAWVMYLNAGVQGIDKMARQLRNHPVSTLTRATGWGMGLTLLLQNLVPMMMGAPDDENNPYYQDLDRRTKDLYYLIPNAMDKDENGTPRSFIKIPKSREWGELITSLIQRTMRAMQGDERAWNGYMGLLGDAVAPSNPLTDNLFAPFIHIARNEDYAGREIVPSSMKDLNPSLQYDARTSEVSKWISNTIAKVVGEDMNLSPKQIDYLIKQTTGFVGDMLLPATTGTPGDIGSTLSNIIWRPFEQKFTADPRYQSGLVEDFYDEKKRLTTQHKSYLSEHNLDSKADTPYKEALKVYTDAQKELGEISEQEKQYLESMPYGPERDAKIDALREKRNKIANDAFNKANDVLAKVDEAKFTKELELKQSKQAEQLDSLDLDEDAAPAVDIEDIKLTENQSNTLRLLSPQGIDEDEYKGIIADIRLLKNEYSGSEETQQIADYIKQLDITDDAKQMLAKSYKIKRDFSSDDAYALGTLSDKAQFKYDYAKNIRPNLSVEQYSQAWAAIGQGEKKADKIQNLISLGWSEQQANDMYKLYMTSPKKLK